MKYSIIIPAYNESNSIKKAVQSVVDFFRLRNDTFEVIVVDDGSVDNTSSIVQNLITGYPEVRLLKNGINSGKGYSIRRGMLEASGEWIMFLDADLSTPVEEFKKMENFTDEYDIIIGSRAVSGAEILKYQSWIKVFLGRAGNLLIRIILGVNIVDTQCGFKIFSKKAKELFNLQKMNRWSFDAEILFLAMRRGLKIKELPVRWTNDVSSTVTPSDYLKFIGDVVKIRYDYWRGMYNGKENF